MKWNSRKEQAEQSLIMSGLSDQYLKDGLRAERSETTALLTRRVRCSRIKATKWWGVYFATLSVVLLSALLIFSSVSSAYAKGTVTFPSKDGLPITLDSYITSTDKRPLIVLFHQAGWSRGEYLEIAPKLNKLGFNAIAIDLRSGDKVNGVVNETAKRAKKAGKGTTYVDALQDIEASLEYARSLVGNKVKVIAWGSSYSAALVLKVAGDHPELANAVLAFSPGEYFKKLGKPADWVKQSARLYTRPVFITSAKSEKKRWKAIFDAIKSKKKIAFIPSSKGHHGSRALWKKYADNKEYWSAVKRFLISVK